MGKISHIFYRALPLSCFSRIAGFIASVPLPRFILYPFIAWFIKKYGVNKEEFEEPEGGFRSFNSFFTRTLKPNARPINTSLDTIVSPVDARIDQFGRIESTTLIQAKGIYYSLENLVPSPRYAHFIDGEFMTLYLAPSDYHRIHSPVDGVIEGFLHVPGKLVTVQESMVQRFPRLFECNERIITFIRTSHGMVGVCKVGATNVGKISLSYDAHVTNKTFRSIKEKIYAEAEKKFVSRGQEIGVFNLGSTVILLFEKGIIEFCGCMVGKKVRMGEKIAEYRN
ncbi:MAG: archaetidylserine decarboxylase [Spirochaetes bacterium]|nr:archaetidylserine decarboxylase [Spirochaetota bacterium]